MKSKISIILAIALCAGCSQSQRDNEKIEALTQKVDLLYSNQVIIKAQLDAMPKIINNVGYYYHTNNVSQMASCLKATMDLMGIQEKSIVEDVNTETRRVSVIMFTNFAGFQADTLDTINQIKLTLPDASENGQRVKMFDDVGQIQRDIKDIKFKLGILY